MAADELFRLEMIARSRTEPASRVERAPSCWRIAPTLPRPQLARSWV
ncbi:MAG: hypothetical protein JO227_03160 [Acetobacteraceae bacterium]|nr:hypothetical protein [Acetobacteraceae bacterium]